MDGDQPRISAAGQPLPDQILDRVVERPPGKRDAVFTVFRGQAGIAGDHGRLAELRHEVGRLEGAVAIDDQPRDARFHQRRVERRRKKARDRSRAGIPGDVPIQLRRLQPERAEHLRDEIGGVVADQHDRALTVSVRNPDGIRRGVPGMPRGFHGSLPPRTPYLMIRNLLHCALLNDFIQIIGICQTHFRVVSGSPQLWRTRPGGGIYIGGGRWWFRA